VTELWQGVERALNLIVTLDPEVLEITGRSLAISSTSSSIAFLICLPLASVIHFRRFPGKQYLISLIQTSFSLPTVVIGLFVYVLFSKAGPLGVFDLMFTPAVMAIGQVILISPVMLGLSISALSGGDQAVSDTAAALGANRYQAFVITLREVRYAMVTAVVMGFGRAVSEVGLSLMVGGNIKGYTRTITTAISLETAKGDIELSIALGIILTIIALVINVLLNRLQEK